MHAATFLENLFAAKPTSPEARTSEATGPDDLRAVERPNAPAGLLRDGPRGCGGLPNGTDGARLEVNQSGRETTRSPPPTKADAPARARETDVRPTAEPKPCPRCSNPILWLLPDGNVVCGNCRPTRPEGVTLAAIVITLPDDRWAWEVEPVDAWKQSRKSVLSIHAGIR